MSEFYNEPIKKRFLEALKNEDYAHTVKYVFIAAKSTEEMLDMDLYNFSLEQIELVMMNLNFTNFISARTKGNYISTYITWCIYQGYRESNIHPMDTVNKDWYAKFVDTTVKLHCSQDEFHGLLKEMINGADQFFLYGLWEGISMDQLINLKQSDIKWDSNELFIAENESYFKVSEECMKYLEKTCNQTNFYNYVIESDAVNSDIKYWNGEYFERELLPSNYVFTNVKSPRAIQGEKVKPSLLYSRLNALKIAFDLEYLTPNSIKQSGQIYMASEIVKSKIEQGLEPHLEYADFSVIGEKYNTTKTRSGDSQSYYNTTLMKQYISVENLKDLYNLEVTM